MSSSPKILISDPLDTQAIEELKKAGLDVTYKTGMDPATLLQTIPPFEVLAVRSSTKVNKAVLEAAENLKLIVRAGVGLDNIDVAAAEAQGIQIENTPHATTVTVAEHTMALMLSLVRHIPQAHGSLQKGEWNRKAFQGSELRGKTLGIIGFGRIGQEVAKRAKAFGMTVIANDHNADSEVAAALEIDLVPLKRLLAESDIVSLHLPLLPETKHLIDKTTLQQMKKGSYMINAARGGIVDEPALAAAIESGHIAGAAFDVFETEPPGNNPLLKLKQVVAVPHLGASTDEGQSRAGLETARVIIAYAKR